MPFTNYIGSNDYNSDAINLNQEVLDLGRVYLDTKSTMHEGVTIVASRKGSKESESHFSDQLDDSSPRRGTSLFP